MFGGKARLRCIQNTVNAEAKRFRVKLSTKKSSHLEGHWGWLCERRSRADAETNLKVNLCSIWDFSMKVWPKRWSDYRSASQINEEEQRSHNYHAAKFQKYFCRAGSAPTRREKARKHSFCERTSTEMQNKTWKDDSFNHLITSWSWDRHNIIKVSKNPETTDKNMTKNCLRR